MLTVRWLNLPGGAHCEKTFKKRRCWESGGQPKVTAAILLS